MVEHLQKAARVFLFLPQSVSTVHSSFNNQLLQWTQRHQAWGSRVSRKHPQHSLPLPSSCIRADLGSCAATFKVADKSHAHSENPNSGSGWTWSFWGSSFTLTFRFLCLQWSFIGPFFFLGQLFLLSSFLPFLLSCFLPFLPPTTPIILLVIPLFLASDKRGVPSTLPSHPRAITDSGFPHHTWSWSHAQADNSAWAQSVPVPVPRMVPAAQGWGCPSCWGWGAPASLQLPCSLVEQWGSPGCQVLPCHPQVTSQHFQSPAAPGPCTALVKDWEKHLCAGKHLNLCLKTYLNWARCLDV